MQRGRILIFLILLLVSLQIVYSAKGYEIELSAIDNKLSLHSLKQFDFDVKNEVVIKLRTWFGDNYIGDAAFNGYYLRNTETNENYLFGTFNLNADPNVIADLGVINPIENPYNGVCASENDAVGCILSNKDGIAKPLQGIGIPAIKLSGFLNEDASEIKVAMYNEFDALLSLFKTTAEVNDLINALAPDTQKIDGLGNLNGAINGIIAIDIIAGYGNEITLTNSNYNGVYTGACYYVNDSQGFGLEMAYVKCVVILKNYIDYDEDGIMSDSDCNDNDISIGTDCPTLTISVSDGAGGGGGGGGGSGGHPTLCTPDLKCSEWSECINGRMTRTCDITNGCAKGEKPATDISCTYTVQGTTESPVEEIQIEKKKIEQNNLLTTMYPIFLALILLIIIAIIIYLYKRNKFK